MDEELVGQDHDLASLRALGRASAKVAPEASTNRVVADGPLPGAENVADHVVA
jgi:hypothetical protein